MTLQQRLSAPTPPFFKKIRRIGLILVAVSGAIIAAPVSLPAIVITAAGYLGVAGTVATVVSQAAAEEEKKEDSYEPPF